MTSDTTTQTVCYIEAKNSSILFFCFSRREVHFGGGQKKSRDAGPESRRRGFSESRLTRRRGEGKCASRRTPVKVSRVCVPPGSALWWRKKKKPRRRTGVAAPRLFGVSPDTSTRGREMRFEAGARNLNRRKCPGGEGTLVEGKKKAATPDRSRGAAAFRSLA